MRFLQLLILLALPQSLEGITTYSDPSLYLVPQNGIFSGIAILSGASGSCSGALIAPDVVLTAAHCLQSGLTVTFADLTGSPTYNVLQQVADPGYNPGVNPNGVDDIALLLLSEDVVPGATIYSLNTNPNVNGDLLTLAGYGYGGQGMETTGFGTLRAGLNIVSGFFNGSTVNFGDQIVNLPNLSGDLAYDFNETNSSLLSGTAPANEAFICYGDSGGPSFLGNVLSSSTAPTIVGVHDFLANTANTTPTCSAKDIAGETNVALFADFISSTEASFETPEPGTLATGVIGFGAILLFGIRRRTIRIN